MMNGCFWALWNNRLYLKCLTSLCNTLLRMFFQSLNEVPQPQYTSVHRVLPDSTSVYVCSGFHVAEHFLSDSALWDDFVLGDDAETENHWDSRISDIGSWTEWVLQATCLRQLLTHTKLQHVHHQYKSIKGHGDGRSNIFLSRLCKLFNVQFGYVSFSKTRLSAGVYSVKAACVKSQHAVLS